MTLLDIVRMASDKLPDDSIINVDLASVLKAIGDEPTASRAVATASTLLRERLAALKDVRRELKHLQTRVTYLGEILPFTAEGWPERREQLAAELADDVHRGLALWLDDWFHAAGQCRHEALRRLTEVPGFPVGARRLLDRCATAAAGLHNRDWYVAEPLLGKGAAGIEISGALTPSPPVRRDVQLLLARLAIATGQHGAAEAALRQLELVSPAPGVDALRLRLERSGADEDDARDRVREAGLGSPTDLDVALELIETARAEDLPQLALDAARTAIAGLPVLVDIEAEVAQLVIEPPGELWVAAAERALLERDLDIHELAMERAEASSPEPYLAAVVAELRVRRAKDHASPVEERIHHLVVAAEQRIASGNVELAVAHFAAAHELDESDVGIALRLADCRIALCAALPLRTSRTEMEEALALLLRSRHGAVPGPLSWSYLTEAQARQHLTLSTRPADAEHGWLSLIAVGRSIAHEPWSSSRWAELAEAADVISLYRVADVCSGCAFELDPEDEGARIQRIKSLIGNGDSQSAEALIEKLDPALAEVLKGYAQVRRRAYADAAATLQAATIDPDWWWATQMLVASLLLSDQVGLAFSEAAKLKEKLSRRRDELYAVEICAWASMVLGNFNDARELARSLTAVDRDGRAQITAAASELLLERTPEALQSLAEHFSSVSKPYLLDDWQAWIKPLVGALAVHHGASPPSLDVVDDAVKRRIAELALVDDPLSELAEGDANIPRSTLELTRTWLVALIRLARREYAGAAEALDTLGSDGLDPELHALLQHARVMSARGTPLELARTVVDDAQRDDLKSASDRLRRLLDVAGDGAPAALLEAASGVPTLLLTLEATLAEVALTPAYRDRALAVLARFDDELATAGGEADDGGHAQPPVRVVLPRTWFDGFDDPVNDHPLFLRFLPEMRLGADYEIPSIVVGIDDELEPDGYRILILDEICEQGNVPFALAYATPDAIEFLGQRVRATDVRTTGELIGVELEPAVGSDSLAELLTMSAWELVSGRISEVIGGRREQISQSIGTTSQAAED